jgi:hypothetical protein
MAKAGVKVNVAKYESEAFTDAIYELVKDEAIRLHNKEGMDLALAGKIAAYLATLPILAIAAEGRAGLADKLTNLCDKLFKDISEL